MRLAVISDIHGNADAFEKVLNDIDHSNIDSVISLGDNIGYGAEPDRVVKLLMYRNITSVLGNHELAVIDKKLLSWFNPDAKRALNKTSDMLSETSLKFIRNFKLYKIDHGIRFVHGVPPNSILTYVFQLSNSRIVDIFESIDESVCIVGHTHELKIIALDDDKIYKGTLKQGIVKLKPHRKYIINAGSVGQPRDGNNNSKYIIFDTETYSVEIKFIPYDIAKAVRKIQKAGMPSRYANRLW